MANVSRSVGLDVHKDTITIAVADVPSTAPAMLLGTIKNDTPLLLRKLAKLGAKDNIAVCYEAGPTGYGLHRALTEAGYTCAVVAPSNVPCGAGKRIKTDKRDAVRLAHFLRSGDLTFIAVPDAQTEAIRDLVRTRDDFKEDERRTLQRIASFLLRHGRAYTASTRTKAHRQWLEAQRFEFESQNQAMREYLASLDHAREAIKRIDSDIAEASKGWKFEPQVRGLQALRGVRFLTAVATVAEIGDFRRFGKGNHFSSYTGLVPSEHSSGGTRRRGSTTKAGNGRVRRLLTESAWAHRFSPRKSVEIQKRSEGLDPAIIEIAWKAQVRLCRKYRRMRDRGMNHNLVITAVARELACFVWSIGVKSMELAAAAAA